MDQTIPSGAYVDPYQIEEYQRANKIPHKIQIIGDVDIEAAQPNAGDHRVIVFFNESAMEFKDKLNIEFPFHLRYHSAKSGGGSVVVNLKHPMLLVRCNGMMPTDIVKAPCCYMCDYCDWNIIQSLKVESSLLSKLFVMKSPL
ncbi:phosphatidylinositol-glycan biosynthesis class X protein-like [Ischnura elegans]|uniref:phosphatidylinositol-glycan biosynthesis class X protein-like n=1 Tax=Ischnura elegans TaxID=197161 RepID=UPI001ED88900|nr:phosphatidylinositol-glycan biosynthesis class X protein-like [Ischnura elegans]